MTARFKPNGMIVAGFTVLAGLALIAAAAPVVAPYDPEAMDVMGVLAGPSLAHPFGLDVLGRYFGRWVDTGISRALDMLLVLPAMLLAITLIAILGPGSAVAALSIALIYLPILARVMRTSTLVVTGHDYVAGSRARGASHLRTLVSHVAPNALGPVVVQASVLSAFALQLEAGLSFLGLGTQPPTPSLGGMLADGRDVLIQAPWVEVFPGLAIVIAVLAFTLLGEGLRRVFDPRGVAE